MGSIKKCLNTTFVCAVKSQQLIFSPVRQWICVTSMLTSDWVTDVLGPKALAMWYARAVFLLESSALAAWCNLLKNHEEIKRNGLKINNRKRC